MRTGLALSGAAFRWATHFYARHFWLVFGLSMIPTAQRFIAVRYGDDLPAVAQVGGEILTGLARLLLVGVVLHLAFREPGLSNLTLRERWLRLAAGIDARVRDFWFQFLVLAAAFVVLDVLPTTAIALWVPDERQNLMNSVLVSAKNPTVIAFTILWMIGVGRTLMVRRQQTVPIQESSAT
ncbi:hypothetical protein [Micromonospora cremea]|uniref:Uncharacterized protein n=1 Tax=Micromonospora cremea TaxID=709881 RepID=A0A1N5WHW5_9ACTN|nr:hypothetical protein [Micromonospora cremea]SIM84798.1 hypothetical protein SAMN04489832_2472 [Micromonospora cremea]